jgi:hypothetical protein
MELRLERIYHLKFIRWIIRLAIREDPDQHRADTKPSIK